MKYLICKECGIQRPLDVEQCLVCGSSDTYNDNANKKNKVVKKESTPKITHVTFNIEIIEPGAVLQGQGLSIERKHLDSFGCQCRDKDDRECLFFEIMDEDSPFFATQKDKKKAFRIGDVVSERVRIRYGEHDRPKGILVSLGNHKNHYDKYEFWFDFTGKVVGNALLQEKEECGYMFNYETTLRINAILEHWEPGELEAIEKAKQYIDFSNKELGG